MLSLLNEAQNKNIFSNYYVTKAKSARMQNQILV